MANPKTTEVRQWLKTVLAAGAVPAEDLEAEANDKGYAKVTVRRAKRDLSINSIKRGDRWYWSDPEAGTGGDVSSVALVAAVQMVARELRLMRMMRSQAQAPAAAPVTPSTKTSTPGTPAEVDMPFDVWSDKDYESVSVEEIRERIKSVTEELEEFMRWHGKLPGGIEGPEDDDRIMDYSREIKACTAELAKARAWLAKKTPQGPVTTF